MTANANASTSAPARPRRFGRLLVMLPLLAFAALAGLFLVRLYSGDPSKLPSALIGRPAPEFVLPPIQGSPTPGFSTADLRQGCVTVVNVWASWCAPCRDEHPHLMALARDPSIVLVGINNKDAGENARRFLGQLGNPYARIGADLNGRVSIDWGVYGVPETFVVDGTGRITYKYVGPLTPAIIADQLMPAIRRAGGAGWIDCASSA